MWEFILCATGKASVFGDLLESWLLRSPVNLRQVSLGLNFHTYKMEKSIILVKVQQ